MKLGFILLAGMVLASCGKKTEEQQQESKLDNVFGKDNRVRMLSTRYPYSAIGMVKAPGKYCTGSLVWHNIVLTNAHCVFDKKGKLLPLKFIAGQGTSKKETVQVVYTWWGTKKPNASGKRKHDWALLRLKKSLRHRGYFGYKSKKNLNPFGKNVLMVGYSGDFYKKTGKAGVHWGCRITGDEHGYYLHNCDTTGGSSGGPMIIPRIKNGKRQYYVIGANAAQRYCDPKKKKICPIGVKYKKSRANIAVKTDRFTKKLTQLRKAFPL